MLSLERILGKDVLSLICLHVHRMCMQALVHEYSQCIRTTLNDEIAWLVNNDEQLYNFRHLTYGNYGNYIFDKYGQTSAFLPKNYK